MTGYVELPSDHQLRAYLAACHPDMVALDRAAHASTIELRMLANIRQDNR